MDGASYSQCCFGNQSVLGGQVLCLSKSAVKVVYMAEVIIRRLLIATARVRAQSSANDSAVRKD